MYYWEDMRRKLLRYLPLIPGLILPILVLTTPLSDPDVWWHLRLGNDMLVSHTVPRTEVYTFTMHGTPFVDFYWLSEIILASLFQLLHPIGLTVVFGLLGTSILIIAGAKNRLSLRSAIGLTIVAVGLEPVFGVRPVVFSWLFFVLLLRLTEKLPSLSTPKTLLYSILIFLPWVNMHDGFILPLGYLAMVLGFQTLWLIFRLLKQDWLPKPFLNRTTYQKLWLVSGVGIVASLITPYGFSSWQTLLHEGLSEQNKNSIGEWSSLVFKHQLGLIYFCLALFVFSLAARFKLWQPHQWIIYSIFFVIGGSGVIHAPFFLLLILPTFLVCLDKIKIPKDFLLYAKLYVTVPLVIGVFAFALFKWAEVPNTKLLEGKEFPVAAVAAAQKLGIAGKVFTSYGWGGYVSYRLPNNPYFIDGRMSSWSRRDKPLLEDYFTIESTKPGFEDLLATDKPNWFLLRPETNLASWLKDQPEYTIVYEDKTSVVIVPKSYDVSQINCRAASCRGMK